MGAVFALFAAYYYWSPKILGKTYNELLGHIHFYVMFIGVNLKTLKPQFKTKSSTELSVRRNCVKRNYSTQTTKKSDKSNYLWQSSVEKMYYNMEESKRQIYKDLKNKSGVYLLLNRESGNSYVGSSLDLFRRMRRYFFEANSSLPNNLIIVRALRKYGIGNFSLIILTFCESDHKTILKLEQLALNLFKPKYNILRIAGSSSGFKHKKDTILKLQQSLSGENHPHYNKPKSPETKKAISDALKTHFNSTSHHNLGKKGILAPQYGIGGKSVLVYDFKTGKLIDFYPLEHSLCC
jgi:group I intron endonuclease